MKLCSSGHDEVCFDSKYCPACEIEAELNACINDLNEEISSLRSAANNLLE